MAKRGDPNQRRQGETHLQWRSRLARNQETDRKFGEKIVTPEALSRSEGGRLEEGYVWHGETGGRAETYRRKSRSALAYMRERGSLTDDQFGSAMEIASVAEMIERSAGRSSASMEAKVDCSGSARDALNESLYRVRAEGAYTEWRSRLPLPRRMVIDMVTQDAGLTQIAAEHNMGWPRARDILLAALDAWPEIIAKYVKRIDMDDLERAHARLRA